MLRRHLLPAVAAFLLPSAARADAPPAKTLESQRFLSLPLLAGVDVADTSPTSSTGFYWGIRPEYVFAWTRPRANTAPLGVGLGPYVEATASTGTSQVWVGGGGTVVGYFGRFGVAASGGVDVDWVRALPSASPVFGLFLGFRTAELSGLDLPFGLRVDVRPGLGIVPTTVIVSAQLDALMALALAMFTAISPAAHGFD